LWGHFEGWDDAHSNLNLPQTEEYLNVVKSYGAKELTDRRIADYIWELDNTGLTISRISSKRYGKERVGRLGVH
jgi:Cdc6-like AAA superfamily ATPase